MCTTRPRVVIGKQKISARAFENFRPIESFIHLSGRIKPVIPAVTTTQVRRWRNCTARNVFRTSFQTHVSFRSLSS